MGKAAHCVLLLGGERVDVPMTASRSLALRIAAIRLQPVIAAEGPASRIQRTLHHLLDEPGIRRVDTVRLTPQDARRRAPSRPRLLGWRSECRVAAAATWDTEGFSPITAGLLGF